MSLSVFFVFLLEAWKAIKPFFQRRKEEETKGVQPSTALLSTLDPLAQKAASGCWLFSTHSSFPRYPHPLVQTKQQHDQSGKGVASPRRCYYHCVTARATVLAIFRGPFRKPPSGQCTWLGSNKSPSYSTKMPQATAIVRHNNTVDTLCQSISGDFGIPRRIKKR